MRLTSTSGPGIASDCSNTVAVRPSTHFFAMFLPAFALAQSFAACESTPTEMHSIRETDFDCFASTGVNTPAQCPRASVVACVKNVAIATWDISDLTTLGFGIVCYPERIPSSPLSDPLN